MRFEADGHIASAWQKAKSGALTGDELTWFQQLAKHELSESSFMRKGMFYRYLDDTGAHFKASTPPTDFPNYDPLDFRWDFDLLGKKVDK